MMWFGGWVMPCTCEKLTKLFGACQPKKTHFQSEHCWPLTSDHVPTLFNGRSFVVQCKFHGAKPTHMIRVRCKIELLKLKLFSD